jgi:hypothetical protein
MAENKEAFEAIRQIYTVLMLHFVDGMKQSAGRSRKAAERHRRTR